MVFQKLFTVISLSIHLHRPVCFLAGNQLLLKTTLPHYSPVLLFYTPWKHQKTFRFSNVFRGYRKATPGCNGLKNSFGGFFVILQFLTWRLINLSRPDSGRRENYIKIFIFTLLCGASKAFKKAFKAFTKPFEAPQRSVKIKI